MLPRMILLLGVAFMIGWLSKPAPPVENLLPAAAEPGEASRRYFIVNADDLGLSDGVTDGIVRARREGVVTSTSALVNLDGAIERIRSAHQQNPEMPIGLHLNITLGRPVLPPEEVPTLVDDDGMFHSPDAITNHLLKISLDELGAELRALDPRIREAIEQQGVELVSFEFLR